MSNQYARLLSASLLLLVTAWLGGKYLLPLAMPFLLGFLLQTGVHGLDQCASIASKADEVEEAGMDFGAAIRAVKQGKKIARKGWNGKSQYVELASNIGYVNPEGEIVNPDHEAIGNKALAFVGTSGVQLGWLASQSDMLAEDWYII